LSPEQVGRLKKLLTRRATHEPIAYIRGKVEFYGRTFIVSDVVLVPRPESEAIIELLLEIYPELAKRVTNISASQDLDAVVRIADIGCGSGALGITAKLEAPKSPNLVVDLVDIDESARKVAKSNVDLFTLPISVIESDLLCNTRHDYHVLLCNLPYVPEEHGINEAAKHEPEIAIYSGESGLNHYNALFNQINNIQDKPLYLLIESLKAQQPEIEKLATKSGYELLKKQDLVTCFKLAG
jgi:release factor glutamine methyltransferase